MTSSGYMTSNFPDSQLICIPADQVKFVDGKPTFPGKVTCRQTKEPDFPLDVLDVEGVATWILDLSKSRDWDQNDAQRYAESFRKNKIDGLQLPNLSLNYLLNTLNIKKFGHAFGIENAVKEMLPSTRTFKRTWSSLKTFTRKKKNQVYERESYCCSDEETCTSEDEEPDSETQNSEYNDNQCLSSSTSDRTSPSNSAPLNPVGLNGTSTRRSVEYEVEKDNLEALARKQFLSTSNSTAFNPVDVNGTGSPSSIEHEVEKDNLEAPTARSSVLKQELGTGFSKGQTTSTTVKAVKVVTDIDGYEMD